MTEQIGEIVSGLEGVTRDVNADFGHLSHEQLNWKPASDSWSVAQCLHHLITINSLYFPMLSSMTNGAPRQSFLERYSPLSGVFGRLLINGSSPDNARKVKTRPMAQPSGSEIEGIVRRFAEHQAELATRVRHIAPEIDLDSTKVTSPLLGFVTYSLRDCLTLTLVHERRHLQQARRVLQVPGFPGSVIPHERSE